MLLPWLLGCAMLAIKPFLAPKDAFAWDLLPWGIRLGKDTTSFLAPKDAFAWYLLPGRIGLSRDSIPFLVAEDALAWYLLP